VLRIDAGRTSPSSMEKKCARVSSYKTRNGQLDPYAGGRDASAYGGKRNARGGENCKVAGGGGKALSSLERKKVTQRVRAVDTKAEGLPF